MSAPGGLGLVDAVADLEERLTEKAALLDEMSKERGRGHDERLRLQGKAEGVRLTLSFVQEYRRALVPGEPGGVS